MTASLHSKVRIGLIWSLISSWGNKLLILILFTVLARVLSPHDLGVFSAALVVFNFLALFVDQGLAEAIVQKTEVSERQLNAVFIANLFMAVMIFVGLWFGAPLVASGMKLPELVDILRIGSVTILLGAICFSQQAMHRRHFNYRWLAICLVVSTSLGGAAAVICALKGYGPWSLVAQTIVSSVVTTVMLWIKPQWKLSFNFDFLGIRSLFSYGLNRLGVNVLDFAYSRCIEIFLAAVLGPVALGIYSVGVRVYQALMQALSGAILDVAHNGFSRLANDKERLDLAYFSAVKMSAGLAVPLFLWMGSAAHELTILLFGSKWEESAEVMQAMACLGAIQVVQFYNGTLFNAIGRPSVVLFQVVIKAVITLVALWLYRDQAMLNIVYAYIAAQLFITPVSYYLLSRLVGISFKKIVKQIWVFLFSSVAACSVVLFLKKMDFFMEGTTAIKLVYLTLLWATVYVGSSVVLGRGDVSHVCRMLRERR